MRTLIKNVLFALSFALLLWFGYRVFFKEEPMGLDEQTQNAAVVEEQDFLARLKELRELKLESDLFDDEEFLSLTDFTVGVVDEDAGRPNPFAPVPGLSRTPAEKKK